MIVIIDFLNDIDWIEIRRYIDGSQLIAHYISGMLQVVRSKSWKNSRSLVQIKI